MTRWKFVSSFTDGQRFEFVPGHNIWDCAWTPVPHEIATVPDPLYGGTHQFKVYETTVDGRVIRFAASEFSNNIWGYYVPASTP